MIKRYQFTLLDKNGTRQEFEIVTSDTIVKARLVGSNDLIWTVVNMTPNTFVRELRIGLEITLINLALFQQCSIDMTDITRNDDGLKLNLIVSCQKDDEPMLFEGKVICHQTITI